MAASEVICGAGTPGRLYTATLAALSTVVAHRERRLTFAGLFSSAMAPPVVVELPVPAVVAKLSPSPIMREAAAVEDYVVIPLGVAFTVGLLWLAADCFLRAWLPSKFGSELDDDGVPRWRCVSGFATQLVFLPILFLFSLKSQGFSLYQWSEVAATAIATEDGARFFDWAFSYIFALYMLTDIVLFKDLNPLLKLHHVGCLLGLVLGLAGVPSGFPFFAAGVLSLEIGSASMNLFCLYPHRRDCLRTYAVIMTASNLLGAYCFLGWAACAEMLPTRTLGGLLSTAFLLIRQKSLMDVLGKERIKKKTDGDSPSPQPERRTSPRLKAPSPTESLKCESPKSTMDTTAASPPFVALR